MILTRLRSSALLAQSSIIKKLCSPQVESASTAGSACANLRFASTLDLPEDTKGTSSSSGYVSTVFGATGFLGRYVVQNLVKIGSRVIVPYRRSEDDCKHLRDMGSTGQVMPLRYDISDEDSIQAAIAGSNVVVNLIGRDYESHSFSFEEQNVWIPERISRLVAEHGSIDRYVHVSALGAESDHPAPQYSTKAKGEEITFQNFPEAIIMRPAHMVGTEDRLLNWWATFAKNTPVVPIIGDGSNKFQPVHVTDVAAAIVGTISDGGKSIGKTFELGGPDVYTVNELVALVFDVIREEPRIFHISFETARLISNAIGKGLMKSIPNPTPKLITFTRNNIRSLRRHYVVCRGALTFKHLGIRPRKIENVLEYLYKYRTDAESTATIVGAHTREVSWKT
ncbi:unnamed protein product [Calypogeia fissa]